MEKLAKQDKLVICRGAEFGYDRWMHDALKTLLNATGMPVWGSSINTHVWEYKPQQPDYGRYYKGKEIGGTHSIDIDLSWNIEFDVSAPDIYAGYCNSPFVLLKCPFNPNGIFFNSTLLASILPNGSNIKTDVFTDELVQKVVEDIIKTVSNAVELELDLPFSGSGSIYHDEQVVDIDTILKAFSKYLDEIEIELSDSLIDPNLQREG